MSRLSDQDLATFRAIRERLDGLLVPGGTLGQGLDSQNTAFHRHGGFPGAGFERDRLTHETHVESGIAMSQIFKCTPSADGGNPTLGTPLECPRCRR